MRKQQQSPPLIDDGEPQAIVSVSETMFNPDRQTKGLKIEKPMESFSPKRMTSSTDQNSVNHPEGA